MAFVLLRIAAFAALIDSGSSNTESAATPDEYAEAVATVEAGVVEVNTDPSAGVVQLQAALAQLREHGPRLADDPDALALRTLAELALARALLNTGDHAGAVAVIDATLISLADAELPSAQLGPKLGALVEARRVQLEARGQAQLRIACSVPCSVYIDERGDHPGTLGPESGYETRVDLPLGEHRVWIEAPGAAPLRTTLTLTEADHTLTLAYPEPSAPAPELLAPRFDRLERPDGAHARERLAPRWAEVSTVLVGAAAVAAGAVLWAVDSRCPGGVDPRDGAACPSVYDTRAAGIALVSAGAITAVTGGVLLIVDEARAGDRRGHELALVWTASF
jgi:hypothetical protein